MWEWGIGGTFDLDGRAPVGRVREQKLSPVGRHCAAVSEPVLREVPVGEDDEGGSLSALRCLDGLRECQCQMRGCR